MRVSPGIVSHGYPFCHILCHAFHVLLSGDRHCGLFFPILQLLRVHGWAMQRGKGHEKGFAGVELASADFFTQIVVEQSDFSHGPNRWFLCCFKNHGFLCVFEEGLVQIESMASCNHHFPPLCFSHRGSKLAGLESC